MTIAVGDLELNLRYECQTILDGVKVPLRENVMKRVDEKEDQSIAETRKKGQTKHDWLLYEHLERSDPDRGDLLPVKLWCELTGSINLSIFDRFHLAQSLCFPVDQCRCPRFRYHKAVNGLSR